MSTNFRINKTSILVAVGMLALLFVLLASGGAYQLGTVDTMTATVMDKERMCESTKDNGRECKWMVLTDEMSFENIDSIWHLKFNSTDVQAEIANGQSYHIKYYGWRIPFLSVYPNIISIDKE